MALEEHDREDLLHDGRAMLLRGECCVDQTPIVIGFRRAGQVSLYCGPDPVFQFNAAKELRRVFFGGRRYAATNGCLVELARQQRGGRVEFTTMRVDPATQTIMLSSLNQWLERIRQAAQSSSTLWRVADRNTNRFHRRLLQWLEQLPAVPEIADRPNA